MAEPSPREIEEEKGKSRRVASLTREHHEALRQVGWEEEEAFELTKDYQWYLLMEGEDEE